jgi:hypothetical protein
MQSPRTWQPLVPSHGHVSLKVRPRPSRQACPLLIRAANHEGRAYELEIESRNVTMTARWTTDIQARMADLQKT